MKILCQDYIDLQILNDLSLSKKLLVCIMSVSYTHLDVYKRQMQRNVIKGELWLKVNSIKIYLLQYFAYVNQCDVD